MYTYIAIRDILRCIPRFNCQTTIETYARPQVIEVDSDKLESQPYSLLSALSEGFFVDISFTANNGEKISSHKTILSCYFSGQTWDTIPPFLSDLPPEVLHGFLHYLYSATLPENLSESTAKQLLRLSQLNQGIGNLGELCSEFLEATAVKNRIRSLSYDLYSTFEHVLQMAESVTGLSHNSSQTDGLQRNELDPAKLVDTTKRAVKQLATGVLKFILLCEIFSKQKTDLSREERQEIIQHCRTRLPCFVELVEKFLIICHKTLSGMNVSQKQEIALYLIPEVEAMWLTSTELGSDTHAALEKIVQKADTDHKKKNHLPKMGTSLSRTLKNVVHLREVLTLKRFQDKASSSLIFVLQKREDFTVMSEDQKLRAVVKAMNKIMTEVADHIHTLHRFPKVFEKKLSWKEWKHIFKVWTSRVSLALRKVLASREVLQPVINRSCELVNQEEFNRVTRELGLINPVGKEEGGSRNTTSSKKGAPRVASVVTPPSGSQSPLAFSVTQLLSSGCHADMWFVLDSNSAHETGCLDCEMNSKEGSVEIPAHRVIIAARCDWFKRALLSGMKESIERRIFVPDTSPCMFRKFLVYLYSGVLDTRSLSIEQMADFLSLSDRYEMDCLKEICQRTLQRSLSEDSVLFVLSVADQYSASLLKDEALRFVTCHPDVTEGDVFEELPLRLKQEVEQRIQQSMPTSQAVVEDLRQAFAMTSFETFEDENDSDGNSYDDDDDGDDVLSRGNSQVERCIDVLKDILGDSVPRRELVRVTLAADCDPNRALNFYFA